MNPSWFPAIVHWLQMATLVAWTAPLVLSAPAVSRTFFRRGSKADLDAGDVFFMALLQMDFAVRWMLWPGSLKTMDAAQLTFWASAYALSTVLALHLAGRFRGSA